MRHVEHSIYEYTPTQARVVALHDTYRTALMNARYYGRHLRWFKIGNLSSDIVVALTSSVAFVGLWKNAGEGIVVFSALIAVAAAVSAIRPLLRITDKIDRYSKLHNGYLDLYYRIEHLVADMRSALRVDDDHVARAGELLDRFRSLELEGDAYQFKNLLLKDQDEIERIIPADRLWLPSQ
jgi:hypothetical protein